MEKEILVSVICTTFNHGQYIANTLESFVMQKTNFNFEVLVHDDASSDDTAKIITEYANKYKDIIVPIIQSENQYSKGVMIIDDILIPKARGKYIALCEGDDFWTDENKLQRQIDFLEKNEEYSACVHNTTQYNCSKQRSEGLLVANNTEHNVELENIIHGMDNAYQTSSLVVRKSVIEKMPEFYYIANKYGFGDYPMAIWCAIKGKIKFLPLNMSTYRLMSNPTSWSSNQNGKEKLIKRREGIIATLSSVKEFVDENNAKLIENEIEMHRFYLHYLRGNFAEMKSERFIKFYKSLPIVFKVKIFIKKILPFM